MGNVDVKSRTTFVLNFTPFRFPPFVSNSVSAILPAANSLPLFHHFDGILTWYCSDMSHGKRF